MFESIVFSTWLVLSCDTVIPPTSIHLNHRLKNYSYLLFPPQSPLKGGLITYGINFVKLRISMVSIQKRRMSVKAEHIKLSLINLDKSFLVDVNWQFIAQFLETPCTMSQVLSLENLIQYKENYRYRKLHMENKFIKDWRHILSNDFGKRPNNFIFYFIF